MSKIDQLIAVFKEVKEDLNKNMNGAMNPGAHKPNATTGTSGGQGGMYRSEGDVKGVHRAHNLSLDYEGGKAKGGQSEAGFSTRLNHQYGDKHAAKDAKGDHKKVLRDIKSMPKPNLTKEEMDKNVNCAAGAQDMNAIKADKNGQWYMDKSDYDSKRMLGGKGYRKHMEAKAAEAAKLKPHEAKQVSSLAGQSISGHEDHPSRIETQDVKRLIRAEECHVDDPHHEAKEKKIAEDIKAKAKKLKDMHKSDELANSIIEKLEKACGMKKEDDSYIAQDGKNREANPKLRESDLGPGGKVHLIKEEGINEEGGVHNRGKFKVMPMAPEKSVKHLDATGKPYNGADKDVKKDEDEDEDKKSKIGHIQGNESEGNDENKAPGRGSLSV